MEGTRKPSRRTNKTDVRALDSEIHILELGVCWSKRPADAAEVELCVDVQGEVREG